MRLSKQQRTHDTFVVLCTAAGIIPGESMFTECQHTPGEHIDHSLLVVVVGVVEQTSHDDAAMHVHTQEQSVIA